MKRVRVFSLSILLLVIFFGNLKSNTFYISSQPEFESAHDSAQMNDTLIWLSGIYSDIFMEIENSDLTIMAESLGATIFTGASKVNIVGDNINFEGFQFLEGNIGTQDVVNIRGSHILFTQINIRDYTCYKYLRVREESQYVEISYCNFENRLNLDDQNILSILVDNNQPGYHKIQYCSFKNFEGIGNDMGIEPIRIGLSTQADRISRTLVEYCYFTQCDGDGELISSKASQNIYRFNTFENNSKAELVLRHGSEAIVYGNFFLNGKGGVRVREGQDHYIYNNYFYELDDRAIFLQNEDSDPLDNINIAFNTIVDCSEIILGGDGNDPPSNVTFANNIFTNPDDNLFEEPTGTETWISNISFGDLGITLPTVGMTIVDPLLEMNSEGFFGLNENSPALNAVESGYALLPDFMGIEDIDTEILFDIMKQSRPLVLEEKDLGCSEYPQDILIQPIATEENTGPNYDTSISSQSEIISKNGEQFFKIYPNPVANQLQVEVESKNSENIVMRIFDTSGKMINTVFTENNFSGKISFNVDVEDLPIGFYTIQVKKLDPLTGTESIQSLKFIKTK